jgi:hypothetical protein
LTGANTIRRAWPLLVLFAAAPSMACLNTFETEFMSYKRNGDTAGMARMVAVAEAAYRKSASLENANDLAVGRILSGQLAEGIQVLRELEASKPGNAIVAANLGTALELSGADEEALQWIRESVRRDPQEHEGSEWVHVKILEAKLALKKDPNWLRKNSVVGWREGQRFPPDERSRPRTPIDIIRAIQYQLDERILFVDAPDAIVGDLYLTMGDIAHSVPGAIPDIWERDESIAFSYDSALRFGTVHEARARERMEAADKRTKAALPAKQAAAAREQLAQDLETRRAQLAESRQAGLKDAKRRRQWLAVGAFATFGVLVAGGLFLWLRKHAAGRP